MTKTLIGRWESRGGAHVVELHKQERSGYCYRATGVSGYLGTGITEAQAIAIIEARCAIGAGYFQPDRAKTPMKRMT